MTVVGVLAILAHFNFIEWGMVLPLGLIFIGALMLADATIRRMLPMYRQKAKRIAMIGVLSLVLGVISLTSVQFGVAATLVALGILLALHGIESWRERS